MKTNLNEDDVRRLADLMEDIKEKPAGEYVVLFGESGRPLGFVIHTKDGAVFVPTV